MCPQGVLTIGAAFVHNAGLVAVGLVAWVLDMVIRYIWMAGVHGAGWGGAHAGQVCVRGRARSMQGRAGERRSTCRGFKP